MHMYFIALINIYINLIDHTYYKSYSYKRNTLHKKIIYADYCTLNECYIIKRAMNTLSNIRFNMVIINLVQYGYYTLKLI